MFHLYRHFNKEGALLYVGMSVNALTRQRTHASWSYWYNEIATITVEHFPTFDEARTAEIKAIKTENPLNNKDRSGHKGGQRQKGKDPSIPPSQRGRSIRLGLIYLTPSTASSRTSRASGLPTRS